MTPKPEGQEEPGLTQPRRLPLLCAEPIGAGRRLVEKTGGALAGPVNATEPLAEQEPGWSAGAFPQRQHPLAQLFRWSGQGRGLLALSLRFSLLSFPP